MKKIKEVKKQIQFFTTSIQKDRDCLNNIMKLHIDISKKPKTPIILSKKIDLEDDIKNFNNSIKYNLNRLSELNRELDMLYNNRAEFIFNVFKIIILVSVSLYIMLI